MTLDIKELDCIKFGITSAEEVVNQAVCKITNTKRSGPESIYDIRMGSTESLQSCKTCGQPPDVCTGHFGYIELNEPVIHPLYYRRVESYLKCICVKCNRLLLTKELLDLNGILRYKGETRFIAILNKLKKVEICCHTSCGSDQPKYKFNMNENTISKVLTQDKVQTSITLTVEEIKGLLDSFPVEDVVLLGFDPELVQPKNFIITMLPILPPHDRPYVKADNKICDDDITVQYIDIIKLNNYLADPNLSEQKRQKYLTGLKFRILTTFNNSQGKAKHTTNNRPIKGIKERLSGKQGQFRGHMLGKRCNQTGRTVIGAEPTLALDELGFPREMADVLTLPERVTNFNFDKLTALVNNDGANYVLKGGDENRRINLAHALHKHGSQLLKDDIIERGDYRIIIKTGKEQLQKGDIIIRDGSILKDISYPEKRIYTLNLEDIVERKLIDGDVVLLNRQPTLHKASMQAMKIKIHKHKTLKMNLAITSGFNADFDGDEMNIHVMQSYDAQSELRELAAAKYNIISAQSSKPNVKIVQDSLLGAYRMTLGNSKLTKSEFFNISMKLDLSPLEITKKIQHIRSVLLSKGKKKTCFNGKGLISLFLPDDLIYEKKNNCNPEEPTVKIYRGVLYEGTIDKNIIGSAHNSLIQILNKEYGPDETCRFVDCIQFVTNEWLLINGFTVGLGDCVNSKDTTGGIEQEIADVIQKSILEADRIKETTSHPGIMEMRINAALNKAKDVGLRIAKENLQEDNHFLSTVISGSKGDFVNIAQITGLLGQQNISGKRIPKVLNNGKRTLPHYPMEGLTSEQEYESRGFISSSFIKGLNPREFYLHAMSGREGITDTATGTATSGYMQRRIIKLTEDIKITYNNTVEDATGRIFQFSYGNNNVDPTMSVKVDGEQKMCDINRLVDKLNMKHEISQEKKHKKKRIKDKK
ncbi:MAG: hypothetical protein ACW98X_13240 [Promethearchaeota archaeon]|jgi:DNA-directed RNA polymerase beta' subunit